MELTKLINILACPDDRGALHIKSDNLIVCRLCGREFSIIEGIPMLLPENIPGHQNKFSHQKWNQYNIFENLSKDTSYYDNYYTRDILKYIAKFLTGRGAFLEIGVGAGFIAMEAAKRGYDTFGIDISFDALLYAKKRFRQKGLELTAVCGDITSMPFKDNIFDFIFGSGVIEHILDTRKAVREQQRCLVSGGITYQTVPAFSFSTMTYGQLWGGIPNVIFLKNIFEIIHMRILRGKHMLFGYEKLFTLRQLNGIMESNKLQVLESGVFHLYRPINFLSNPRLIEFCNKLLQYRPFCHMIYTCAKKQF